MELRKIAAGLTVVTATLCAVLPVAASYASGWIVPLLGAAAVGGAAATATARAARWSATSAVLASLAGMVGTMVTLGVWLPRPAGSLLGTVLDGVRQSGAVILTSAVPVPLSLATAVLPVGVTWLTATAAVVLLASGRPSSAALPPVLLFVGAVVFRGPTDSPAYGYVAALVAALALLLGLLRGAGSGRAAVAGAAALAAALGVGTLWAGPAMLANAPAEPPDPRSHVVPPYQNPENLNPLSLLSAWAAEPDHPLLEVRGALGGAAGSAARLRWVTLPEFTGVTWLPASHYRAAGANLPAMAPAGTTRVAGEVSITGLTGGWLPAPEGVREVRGVRVAVDLDSATLAAPDGIAAGLTYAVTAEPPSWPVERLRVASLPSAESFDRYRELPAGEPARLYEIAPLAAGTGRPYQQAKRLESYLRQEYLFDARAPGGNGYPSLGRFLSGTGTADGGRGTSEQFATAFAVLARALGMPARVVVGFETGQPLGGDRYLVRTGDALAWAEVYLDGIGWVPFDPTPEPTAAEDRAEAPRPGVASTPSAAPGQDLSGEEGDDVGAVDAALPPPVAEGGGVDWFATLATLAAVLAGAAGAALLGLGGLRLRRSTVRLRRKEPAERVLGAWEELRDALRLAGRSVGPPLVAGEVAALVGEAVGGELRDRAGGIAAAVNAVAFSGVRTSASAADRVVADVRAFRRVLRRGATLRRRCTWWVDPRPLWWR